MSAREALIAWAEAHGCEVEARGALPTIAIRLGLIRSALRALGRVEDGGHFNGSTDDLLFTIVNDAHDLEHEAAALAQAASDLAARARDIRALVVRPAATE